MVDVNKFKLMDLSLSDYLTQCNRSSSDNNIQNNLGNNNDLIKNIKNIKNNLGNNNLINNIKNNLGNNNLGNNNLNNNNLNNFPKVNNL